MIVQQIQMTREIVDQMGFEVTVVARATNLLVRTFVHVNTRPAIDVKLLVAQSAQIMYAVLRSVVHLVLLERACPFAVDAVDLDVVDFLLECAVYDPLPTWQTMS